MSEVTTELGWFPTYPDKILSSVHWSRMKDFQRGWYWHLLLLMTRSKPRIGYLPLDGHLWALAGSHSKQYWEGIDADQRRPRYALVLDCFKVAEIDGQRWIYNRTLLNVLHEQQHKHDKAVRRGQLGGKRKNSYRKQSLNSYSEEFKTIWENHVWNAVSKKTAAKAFEKAVADVLASEGKNGIKAGINREQAIEFLADAMEEFKTADAGRMDGLFEGYSPPYPATWLNGQRYFDDRKSWYKPRDKPANGIGRGYIPPPKKSGEPA